MPQLNARLAATDANTSPTTPPSDDGRPPLADAYLRHRAWLTALLARRYGPDEAADIAQDTWLRVHRYEPPAPIRSPKSLLARIALNLAANRLRKTARETLTDPHDEGLARQRTEASQEQAVFFEQMMLALPPKLRDVFALNHVRGLTYREIAQLRGISVKAVEKRMTQAIARCADMIRG
jgi:RNA polymerase sigma factor (sigma-70 family)